MFKSKNIHPVRAMVIILVVALIGLTVFAVFYINFSFGESSVTISFVLPPKKGMIVSSIEGPKVGKGFGSPLTIKGHVNGNGWAGFEGQVGIVDLIDKNGAIIGTAVLNATNDWMSENVNFEATLEFQSDASQKATLLFRNENPSDNKNDNREYHRQVEISKTN